MKKIKVCIAGSGSRQEVTHKLLEEARKNGNDSFIETLKNLPELIALEAFREDKEEFEPRYRRRHWKRAKGVVGTWKK